MLSADPIAAGSQGAATFAVCDVNHDHVVNSLDVAALVNYLRVHGSGPVSGAISSSSAAASAVSATVYDVNGDGFINVLDVAKEAQSLGSTTSASAESASAVAPGDTVVEFDATIGGQRESFQVELFNSTAPQTAANFLNYVNSGEYNNTFIHRVTTNSYDGLSVVQGGGYSLNGAPFNGSNQPTHISTSPTATNFTSGLPNEYSSSEPDAPGTIAMALNSGSTGPIATSGASEWFINVGDNSQTLSPSTAQDGVGYAVFGKVLGDGMQVVEQIQRMERIEDVLGISAVDAPSQLGVFGPMPVANFTTATTAVDANNLVVINSVAQVPIARHLAVIAPPPSIVAAGIPFDLQVAMEDDQGNVDPTFTGNITIALANNPASGTLGGTLTRQAFGGIALYTDLTIDQPGTGYTLTASSGVLSSLTAPFGVEALAPVVITNWTSQLNAQMPPIVSVSGTAQAYTQIELQIYGDSTPLTKYAFAQADGTWSFSNIDLSSMDDGLLTYSASSTNYYSQISADNRTVIKDTVLPRVTQIDLQDAATTSATSVHFLVNFSEFVHNVTADDFQLVTGLAGATITGVTPVPNAVPAENNGDGISNQFVVTVATGQGHGSLALKLSPSATIVDQVDNPLEPSSIISPAYNIASGHAPQPPSAPGNFTATATRGDEVQLNWSSAKRADGYDLYMIEDGQPVFIANYGSDVTSATVRRLAPNTTYFFNLVAYNAAGTTATLWQEATTTSVNHRPVTTTPDAPGNFIPSFLSATEVTLTWSAAARATGYHLYEYINDQPVLIGTYSADTTSATITGIGYINAYNLVAFNAAGSAATPWIGVIPP